MSTTTLYAAVDTDIDPFAWYRSPPPSSMSFMDFSCSSSSPAPSFPIPIPRTTTKKSKDSKTKKRKVMVMRRPLPLSLDPVSEADEDAFIDEGFYSGCESQEPQRSKARPRRREATVWPEDEFQVAPERLSQRRGSDDDIAQTLAMLQFPVPPATIPTSPTKRAPPPPSITIVAPRRGSDGSPLSPIDPEMPPISPMRPHREPETPHSPSFNPLSCPTSPTFFSPLFNGFDPSPTSRRPSIASLEPRTQQHTRQLSDSSVSSSGVSESDVNTDDCIESWDVAIDEIYRMVDDPDSPIIDSYPTPLSNPNPLSPPIPLYDDLVAPNEIPKPAALSRTPASSFPHKRKAGSSKRGLATRRGAAPSPLNLNRPPPTQAIPSPPFSPAESLASRRSRNSYIPAAPSKLRKGSLETNIALAAEWLKLDSTNRLAELTEETEVERVLSEAFPPTPISPPRKSGGGAPPPIVPKSILRNTNSIAFPTSPTSPMSMYSPLSSIFSPTDTFPLSPTTPASAFTFSHTTLPHRRKSSSAHQRPLTLRSKFSGSSLKGGRDIEEMHHCGGGSRSEFRQSPIPVDLLIR